jgi:hypothetical protein
VEHLIMALSVMAFLGLAAAAAITVLVFSPVVITVDSRRRQLRVRWLRILEYLRPLPGGSGKSGFYVFQKPVPFAARETAKKPKAPKPRKKRRLPARFFMRCLGNSGIRRKLAQQISKLLKRIFHSVDVARSESEVSLPDPALNGMLAGALASIPRRLGVRVNFTGENSLFLELRLHPHRVLKAILFFTSGLPYWAMFKQWRALAAVRPK